MKFKLFLRLHHWDRISFFPEAKSLPLCAFVQLRSLREWRSNCGYKLRRALSGYLKTSNLLVRVVNRHVLVDVGSYRRNVTLHPRISHSASTERTKVGEPMVRRLRCCRESMEREYGMLGRKVSPVSRYFNCAWTDELAGCLCTHTER